MSTILPGLGREPLKEKGWAEKGLKGNWKKGGPGGSQITSQGKDCSTVLDPTWEVWSELCVTWEAFSQEFTQVVTMGKEERKRPGLCREEKLPHNALALETADLYRRKGCPKFGGGVGGKVCPLTTFKLQIVSLLFASGTIYYVWFALSSKYRKTNLNFLPRRGWGYYNYLSSPAINLIISSNEGQKL